MLGALGRAWRFCQYGGNMKKLAGIALALGLTLLGMTSIATGQEQPGTGTVRLLYPQWQGGNFGKSYPMGAHLLAWLAPESTAPLLEVPVQKYNGSQLPLENGIVGRTVITAQMRAARSILDANQPNRVITFGGDCLVSQAPFSYLNDRYNGMLGVLWIDAHPDVTTPRNSRNAHAMVLGNLLGEGDPELAREVRRHIDPKLVMFAGLDDMSPYEWEVVKRLGMRRAGSADVAKSSNTIIQWIRDNDIKHLAIHFDLDVLDPQQFRSQLFNIPGGKAINAPSGKLTFQQVVRLINDVATRTEVVGFTIAEHMPWDDINLMDMMNALPFMK